MLCNQGEHFILPNYIPAVPVMELKEFSLMNVNWVVFTSNKLSLNTLKHLNETALYYPK